MAQKPIRRRRISAPRPARQPAVTRDSAPRYRIVAVSLYNSQAESVELAAASLKRAGYRRVSRSYIIQTMIERLLKGKSPEQIVDFFEQTDLRRPLTPAASRAETSVPPGVEASIEGSTQHPSHAQRHDVR